MTYRRYLTFYNRMYFKEVTHQEQGIELYDMALEQMKIPEHIEKLDGKFTKLHDFANLQSEKKTTKAMNALTIVGSTLILPSLVIAWFGLDEVREMQIGAQTLWVVASAFVGFIFSLVITNKGGK